MNIRFGKWMLKPYGNYGPHKRNWQLYELREPKAKKGSYEPKSAKPKWYPMDEYFQSFPLAMRRALEYELRDEPGEWDAHDATELLRAVTDVVDRVDDAHVEGE